MTFHHCLSVLLVNLVALSKPQDIQYIHTLLAVALFRPVLSSLRLTLRGTNFDLAERNATKVSASGCDRRWSIGASRRPRFGTGEEL